MPRRGARLELTFAGFIVQPLLPSENSHTARVSLIKGHCPASDLLFVLRAKGWCDYNNSPILGHVGNSLEIHAIQRSPLDNDGVFS